MNNKLIPLILVLAFGFMSPVFSMSSTPQDPLDTLKTKVEVELNSMDMDLAQAARDLAGQDLAAPQVNTTLLNLYNAHDSVVDVATISPNGTLLMIQPTKYRDSVGINISNQDHFMQLRNSNGPVMSKLFKTVEDFNAVSLAYPVVASDSLEKIGYLSIVFQPQALIRVAAKQAGLSQADIEIMAIQDNGRIIYDKDPRQVGKMTFSDPLYQKFPSVLALAKNIVAQDSGNGVYEFTTEESNVPVKKEAVWTTINLRSASWRLVLAKEIE